MNRLIVLILLLLAGCTAAGVEESASIDTPAPPAGNTVASITIENSVFDLYARGDCLVLEVITPGLESKTQEFCPSNGYPLTQSSPCGWSQGSDLGERCDTEIPVVLFGQITSPDVAWACIAREELGSGNVSVRFLDFGPDGYILEPARLGEGSAAHLFTAYGARYGEPPLDAPSDTIYSACESLLPSGPAGPAFEAEITIELDPQLRQDDVVVFLDSGLGEYWLSPSDSPAMPAVIIYEIDSLSRALTVRIEHPESTEVFAHSYSWPEALISMMASGDTCEEWVQLDLTITAAVLDNDVTAVSIAMSDSSPCVQ